MRNENWELANRIYEVEHASCKERKEWEIWGRNGWDLTDNVWMTCSDDKMVWYIWKDEGAFDTPLFKCVPRMYHSRKRIAEILKAQLWTII